MHTAVKVCVRLYIRVECLIDVYVQMVSRADDSIFFFLHFILKMDLAIRTLHTEDAYPSEAPYFTNNDHKLSIKLLDDAIFCRLLKYLKYD
jgi:hypothetical protein